MIQNDGPVESPGRETSISDGRSKSSHIRLRTPEERAYVEHYRHRPLFLPGEGDDDATVVLRALLSRQIELAWQIGELDYLGVSS